LQLEIRQIGVICRERAQIQLQQRFSGLGSLRFFERILARRKKKAAGFVIAENRRLFPDTCS
jgi:hypothetical protein